MEDNKNFRLITKGKYASLYESTVHDNYHLAVRNSDNKTLFEHYNSNKQLVSYSSGAFSSLKEIRAFNEGAEMIWETIKNK